MARIKYYFNTETLQYEKVRTSPREWAWTIAAFLLLAAAFGGLIVVLFRDLLLSGTEARIRKENEELKFYYELLQKDMAEQAKVLSAMQARDEQVYRTLFGSQPLERDARLGLSERYQRALDREVKNQEIVWEAIRKAEALRSSLFQQAKSLEQITQLAQRKQDMLAHLPAIQPVRKSESYLASGFGTRIDPVYHTRKFHSGMDFVAKPGVKIFATGDGVVENAGYLASYSGYGLCVVVDHGFGYKTLYAHMSKALVKAGKKVKRGDVLGLVGSTGKSVGPHLHYEVIKDGERINPVNFYFNDLSPGEYQKILVQAENAAQAFD